MTTPPGTPPPFGSDDEGPGQPGGASSYGQPAGSGQPWGAQPQQPYPQQGLQGAPAGHDQGAPAKSNGMGIAALVLGILSIPAAFFAGVPGIVLGLLAIVFGIIGLRKVKARRADNKGMAIAGLITGVIGLVLGAILLALIVFVTKTTADCTADLESTGDQAAYEQCVQDTLTD